MICRWIETLSAYTFTIVHPAGRVHNNADSMSRRQCYGDKCRYCGSYEQRYYLKIADLNAGLSDVVQKCNENVGVTKLSPCPALRVILMMLFTPTGTTMGSLCQMIVPSKNM